ncbi:Lrp/AsnC family transcriptional regulator [Yinghuangia seranimata]|uniref:Lrp/AsnC family transcriptional regulator n=1 Tax=Yinghuangia seranimata TaxID=408067 RepID=UPI00248ACE05|nr:Lrp/AsnC family transcriptional regulator [Yinghuangia seranimata]MDI2126767.1 Lrp/AsnC family transcriptional regulator [Yinghuangia seranimata]
MPLDDLDEQIVAHLIRDARASYAEIGTGVGLSAPAVKRRVDRLRGTGVIKGFTARVDPHALGWTTEAHVEVFCAPRTSPAALLSCLERFPEVVRADTVTGKADAVVRLLASDIRHLEAVLERLREEPVVLSTRSTVVLNRLLERPGDH